MAAAGRAGLVRIWDATSGQQISDVQISNRRIFALAYSPDGKLLAAGGHQRVVRLLDSASGKVVADLPERPGDVMALCFCGPDTLASAGSGNVIHVWDIASQRERCQLLGHTGSITTLVFNRSETTLISGSYDTTVRVWDVKRHSEERINAATVRGVRRSLFPCGAWEPELHDKGQRYDTEVDVGLFWKSHKKHTVPAPHSKKSRKAGSRFRICRFEQMESRDLLSVVAPSLNLGATYYQPYDGNDSIGSLLYISWNGGARARI